MDQRIQMYMQTNIIVEPDEFCPNKCFRGKVIELLYDVLFDTKQTTLEEVYKRMTTNLNKESSKSVTLYPIATDVRIDLDRTTLSRNGKLYAGHDLPVWLGNPCKADVRLMIISQDPRRSEKEMERAKKEKADASAVVTLSTPFGLHDLKWRSNKCNGIIHYAVCEALEHYKKEKKKACVYYTDMFKLRKAGKQDETTIDKQNIESYIKILQKEIELFEPTKIILLGKEVAEMFDSHISSIPHGAEVVKLIHTSQRAWGAVTDPCIKQKYYLAGITSKMF